MSAIVGCFNGDGGAVDSAAADRMLARVSHRGPDGSARWTRGPVALGHATLRTTPESLRERQPWWDEAAGVCVVMDGRISNRKHLVAACGMSPASTDVEIVCASYRRWGADCAQQLVGDFAFALWDDRAGRLYCARDVTGRKPFFYASLGASLLFASEPCALLAHPGISRLPNEAVAAEYLTFGPRSLEETLLHSVRRLPPAHSMLADSRGTRLTRYWSLDSTREVRYRDDAEYVEHFREVFDAALADCMRSPAPVGVALSGGLDSTALFCSARDLRSYSMTFPGTVQDETPYIRAALDPGRAGSTMLSWRSGDPGYFASRARDTCDFPGYPNGDLVFAPLFEAARKDGVRVMLTGHGGDEALSGSVYHYADLIRGLQLLPIVQQLKADRQLSRGDPRQLPFNLGKLDVIRYGVMPLIPRPWARDWSIVRALRGYRLPPWVRAEFCKAAGLDDRLRAPRMLARDGSFARQHMVRAVTFPWGHQEAEVLERLGASFQVELRSPFLDRRVLEFALALPERQRWRGQQTKFVLREAMRGSMPESIRLRHTKAEFSHLVARTLGELNARNFWKSMEASRRGWIDGGLLEEAARTHHAHFLRGSDTYLEHFWALWMAAGIEFWLRGLGGSAAGDSDSSPLYIR